MLLTHPTTAMATASDTTMNSTNKLLLLPTLSLSLCLSHSPLLPFLLNVPTTTTITTTLGNWAVSGQGLGTHGYARMCFSSSSGKSEMTIAFVCAERNSSRCSAATTTGCRSISSGRICGKVEKS